MKRDLDLIRQLLLKLEALSAHPLSMTLLYPADLEVEGYSADQVIYHVRLIAEFGLIEPSRAIQQDGGILFQRLTWEGHDFLDSVRDNDIWHRTKRGAEAAGSFTYDLLKELAKGFIRTQIEKHTGVN